MARVLCTSPNASELISGIKFSSVDGGMLSEEVSDDIAADFCAIPGYTLHAGGDKSAPKPKTKAKAGDTDSGNA